MVACLITNVPSFNASMFSITSLNNQQLCETERLTLLFACLFALLFAPKQSHVVFYKSCGIFHAIFCLFDTSSDLFDFCSSKMVVPGGLVPGGQ